MNAIDVKAIAVRMGGRDIISDISVTVTSGESVGLVGANGSGKSSLLNAMCGYYPIRTGSVEVLGKASHGMRPDDIAKLGIGRSFQSVGRFESLTVEQFVMLGFERSWEGSRGGVLCFSPQSRRREREALVRVAELLTTANLAGYRHRRLSQCPYGARKIVDVIRAIAGRPRILLLDEPTSGVDAGSVEALRDLCMWFMTDGAGEALVIVDHDVPFVRSICPRLVALSAGKVIADGTGDDVLANEAVIATFLGDTTDRPS
jgi:branched-chain amino acid transport system ATP-binding protein